MGHNFVFNNEFFANYVRNIALAYLSPLEILRGPRSKLFAHNFKKFFAECILEMRNALIGRALLIETLMYEQELMAPLFPKDRPGPGIERSFDLLLKIAFDLARYHEFVHFGIEQTRLRGEATDIGGLFAGRLQPEVDSFREKYGEELAEELVCDAAAAETVMRNMTQASDGLSSVTVRRMIVFSIRCFAHLASLQRSALETAEAAAAEDDRIQLGAVERPKEPFSFAIGRDTGLDLRGDVLIRLLAADAEDAGQVLFGDDAEFPLTSESLAELDEAFANFMEPCRDSPVGLTGTDMARRGLAQLLAEALHGADDGARHLLWRSKVFWAGDVAVYP